VFTKVKLTVGTLRTGYPRVQASSQDNGPHLPAEVSSETVTCPRGSGQLRGHHVSPRLGLPPPARGSSGATTCPRGSGSRSRLGAAPRPPCVPVARALALGSGQLRGCHVSPGLCGLQAIMISIGAGTPVSSKALRDKGCSARSQGMQQAAH
jgi:hypothetical protein